MLAAPQIAAPMQCEEEAAELVGFADSSDEEDFWALVGCDPSSDGEEDSGGDPWPGVDAFRCAGALRAEGFVVVRGATGGALAAALGADVEAAASQQLLRSSPNALQTGRAGERTVRAKVGVEELEVAARGAPVLDDAAVVAARQLCPALRDFGSGAARVLASRLGRALGGVALRVDEVKAARHEAGGCFPAHFDTTETTGRVITAILYLAERWRSGDGGELRLYPAGGDADEPVDVAPERDVLVLFSSLATLHRN